MYARLPKGLLASLAHLHASFDVIDVPVLGRHDCGLAVRINDLRRNVFRINRVVESSGSASEDSIPGAAPALRGRV